MNSTEPSTNLESASCVIQGNASGVPDDERGASLHVDVRRLRKTHLQPAVNAKNVAIEYDRGHGGDQDWKNVLYGRQENASTRIIPLLVRSLDCRRTIRDLIPQRVIRELQTRSGMARGGYCYIRLTRGGLLALGTCTAEVAVRSQRVRYLDGAPVEVTVPLWHGQNAAKIRRVPTWISDEDMRESLYKSAGVVSVRRLIAYGAPGAEGRRRDKPQTSVVLVFCPELSRLPDSVTLCGVQYNVEPYSLPPTQCMRCQMFGHEVAKCPARVARCKVCAGPHDYRHCDFRGRRLKCANCEGPHAATFAMCPFRRSLYTSGITQKTSEKVTAMETCVNNYKF
ncbi:hypothetical protein HPB51_017774 [Rhipicephalus microplus]|uniref:Uncharacterized protein n=1 Tax=Rhipicephalus microplus TaxID=6941 RepID=A0A9J6EBS1_RHIMP|nr:hypothetical protein HPB51_017774 [Rhipicephalus microplus]